MDTNTPPANMILHDNEFGSSDEDAWRRDFTVNAIFYDPVANDIKDFTGMGLPDLQSGIVRIIGDPGLRFEEDPVRLLRALKLVGQYGFSLEPETEKALVEGLDLISHASPSRLSLELEKILKNPYGDSILNAFHKFRFLPYFLPFIDKHWAAPFGIYMRELFAERNRRVREGAYRDSVSLAMGAIVLPFIEERFGHHGHPGCCWENSEGIEPAVWDLIREVFQPRQLTKRLTASTLRMLLLQPRFHERHRASRLMQHPGYSHARELMALQNQVKWNKPELLDLWPARSRSHEQEQRRGRWRNSRSPRRENPQQFAASPEPGIDEDAQD